MHSIENKVTYDTTDTWIFDRIPGFKDFYLLTEDESDREFKYTVF